MFSSDPPLVRIAEPIVDLNGGGKTWEEGRVQSGEGDVENRQDRGAKRENKTESKMQS